MARSTIFRNLAISGAAALSFASVSSPSTNSELSTQRGGKPADASQTYARLYDEAASIAREFYAIEFQSKSLQNAQQGLASTKGNVVEQVRELETMNTALQERIAARNARVDKFHAEMLDNPHISEADANTLYTGPFEGTIYADYYKEKMAYRDECKRDTDCMTRMDDSEASRKFSDLTKRAGLSFTTTLAGLFGFGAASGAVGNFRRRRTEKKHLDRLADTRDMLKPKGR